MADYKKTLEFRDISTAYQNIRDFIAAAPEECRKYSLRANSYIVKEGG